MHEEKHKINRQREGVYAIQILVDWQKLWLWFSRVKESVCLYIRYRKNPPPWLCLMANPKCKPNPTNTILSVAGYSIFVPNSWSKAVPGNLILLFLVREKLWINRPKMEYADHDKRMLILIIISNLPFPRLIIVQVLTVLFYVFCQHLWSFEKQEKKDAWVI